MEKSKMLKKYCKIIITLFILAVIPMFIISFYNHPSNDDFEQYAPTPQVWRDTHSLLATMKCATQACVNMWNNWGGIYTANFFQVLHPGIFGEQYYCIGAIVVILSLILSNVIAAWYLVRRVLGGGRSSALCIAAMMSFAMLEWLPSPAEGIYWYNGAVCYTTYQASFMAIVCLMTEILRSAGKAGAKRMAAMSAAVVLLGAWQGGGNQLCAFSGALIMCAFIAAAVFTKNKKLVLLTSALFCAVSAFALFNIMCPGTAIRVYHEQLYYGANMQRPGFVKAVWLGILDGAAFIKQWSTPRVWVLLLLALPVIATIMGSFCKRTAFDFRYPVLVMLLSAAWICALFTPGRYAHGKVPQPGRVLDWVYYSYVVLLFLNEVYLVGFVYKSGIAAAVQRAACFAAGKIKDIRAVRSVCLALKKINVRVAVDVAMVALLLVIVTGKKSSTSFYKALYLARTSSTTRALGSLVSGKAKRYSDEYNERVKIYNANKGKDVVVKRFSVHPGLIYIGDLELVSNRGFNSIVAHYYGLKSVQLEKEYDE